MHRRQRHVIKNSVMIGHRSRSQPSRNGRSMQCFVQLPTVVLLSLLLLLLLNTGNIRIPSSVMDILSVQAQSHRSYRTCSMNLNDPINLYFDSTLGRYQLYDDSLPVDDHDNTTNNTTTSTNHTVRQIRQRRMTTTTTTTIHERIRFINERIRTNNEKTLSQYDHTLLYQQQQQSQQRPSWYDSMNRFLHQLIVTNNNNNNNDDDMNHVSSSGQQQQPAIAMLTTTTTTTTTSNNNNNNNNNMVIHRDLATTTTTTTTTGISPTTNSRGDGDKVNNINPNIELYEPYDNKIVSVKQCHCSNSDSNYTYYCPLNKAYCYVPVRFTNTKASIYDTYPYYYHPVCIPTPNARTYVARYVKLIGCAALALILIFLLISPTGHDAIRYGCFNIIIPYCCWCLRGTTSKDYNQRYVEYMIEKDSKLTNYYFERYMKDQNREERFNQRYIELQRLHGEVTSDQSDEPTDIDENEVGTTRNTVHAPTTATTNGTTPQSNTTATTMVLDELEESIVRDIYYYRPSLLLKTRIYDGPSPQEEYQSQRNDIPTTDGTETCPTVTTNPTTTTDEVQGHSATTISCPHDTDDLLSKDTDTTDSSVAEEEDMNINNNNDDSNRNRIRRDDATTNMDTTTPDGCMICFNAIEIGCKVGVLPNCQHLFHTECLKDWLKRRNVCPLCLDTDVAMIAFSRKNDTSTTETQPVVEAVSLQLSPLLLNDVNDDSPITMITPEEQQTNQVPS